MIGITFRKGVMYLSQGVGIRMKTKVEQEKKYSLISNVIYNMRSAKEWDPKLFNYQLLMIFPDVVAACMGVLLPAWLVKGLEEKWDLGKLLFVIFLLAFGIWLFEMLREGMQEYLYRNSLSFHLYYEKCCFAKIMDMDYEMLEEPKTRELTGNTLNVIRNEFGIRNSFLTVPKLLCGMSGTGLYGILIGRESLLLLLILGLNTAFSFLLLSMARKKHEKYHGNLSSYTAKASYISRQTMEKTAGKEIRMYRMADWFLQKYEECLKGIDDIYGHIHNWYFVRGAAEALLSFLSGGFSYGYLIYRLVQGNLGTADFVFYMGLLGGFSTYFGQMIYSILSLNELDTSIRYIRKFLSLPESVWNPVGIGEERLAAIREKGITVELVDISYTYPGAKEPVLSDISLVIHPGERLALIGLNGAGKTTLVKLLCGFYQPSKGEIRINGIPAAEFSREEYYSLVSVMFQDSCMLPVTLNENLTGQKTDYFAEEKRSVKEERLHEKTDPDRLAWALKISGFQEKYESLPEKGDTLLVREANKEALDFSGGERQKLLFARAIYKEAPLLILDEPTAALDPIAENELYQKYGEAVKGRTCIYISHRLSSTRFCDRICLLSGGKIVEEGTHDELMEKKGSYANLYEVQSRYYREQDMRRKMEEAFDE